MSRPESNTTRQRRWRIAGLMTLGGCGALAVGGSRMQWAAWPAWAMIGYWLTFLLLLLVTFYIVLVDIRFIRAEYAVMKRELFRETLGDETLRRALIEGERRQRSEKDSHSGAENGSRRR